MIGAMEIVPEILGIIAGSGVYAVRLRPKDFISSRNFILFRTLKAG